MTLFMSETYPNSGRNLPEIETLAGIVLPDGNQIPATAGRRTGRVLKLSALPFQRRRSRAQPPPQSPESNEFVPKTLEIRASLSPVPRRKAADRPTPK